MGGSILVATLLLAVLAEAGGCQHDVLAATGLFLDWIARQERLAQGLCLAESRAAGAATGRTTAAA